MEKRKIVLFALMVLMFATVNILAVVIDSNQTIGAGVYTRVDVTNNAVLDITGGDIMGLFPDSNTVVNVYNGVIRSATLSDGSTLNLKGGTTVGVYPNEATVNIFYLLLNDVHIGEVQDGNCTVTISGVWENGNIFSIDLDRVSPDMPNINLIQVPEPATILLLTIGGLFLRSPENLV